MKKKQSINKFKQINMMLALDSMDLFVIQN